MEHLGLHWERSERLWDSHRALSDLWMAGYSKWIRSFAIVLLQDINY